MSCGRPSKTSSSLTLPFGPSNSYAFSTAIHGIRRRSAASASRARVKAFSLISICWRAASHVSGDTTGGVCMADFSPLVLSIIVSLLSLAMSLCPLTGALHRLPPFLGRACPGKMFAPFRRVCAKSCSTHHRHARPCAGHRRLFSSVDKAWMAGTSPAMTMKESLPQHIYNLVSFPGQPCAQAGTQGDRMSACSWIPAFEGMTDEIGGPFSCSAAAHRQLDRHVVARRMRVGADLLMRLLGEGGELGLRQVLVLNAQRDGEAEAAAVARTDRDRAGDLGLARILLLLLGDEIDVAAEAGGVARGEEMLGRRGVGLARPAHRLRHREIGRDHAVARLGMTVAPARRGGGRGE